MSPTPGAGARTLPAALLLASSSACDSPGEPGFASVDPLAPAASACLPPFERIGPAPVTWADLDTGRSCTAFLEQDECVLAVFRDCSVDGNDRRGWQGRIEGSAASLRPFFDDPSTADRRTPTSCTGTVSATAGAFGCDLGAALGGEDPHGGLVFEVTQASPQPWGDIEASQTFAAPSDRLVGAEFDPRSETIILAWRRSGVRRLRPNEGTTEPLSGAPEEVLALAVSGSGAIAAVNETSTWLWTPGAGSRVRPRGAVAVGLTSQDVVVAFEASLSAGPMSAFEAADTASVALAGPVVDLAVSPSEDAVFVLTEGSLEQWAWDGTALALRARTPHTVEAPRDLFIAGDAGVVGWVGRCWSSLGQGPAHCLFFLGLNAGADAVPSRVPVPDVETITAAVGVDAQNIVVASTTGHLPEVQRDGLAAGFRAQLQTGIDAEIAIDAWVSSDDRLWAVGPSVLLSIRGPLR